MNSFKIVGALAALLVSQLAFAEAPQLHLGRYLGYLKPDGTETKIALAMDLYLVQPNDLTQFPKMNALIRLGLGGPQSGEYATQLYEDLRYDYDNGVLSIDAPENDLVITAQVSGTDFSFVDGQAFVRSSALTATIHLVEFTDDPDNPGVGIPASAFKPLLSGEYQGLCGNDSAVLQIEIARGLSEETQDHAGLARYVIQGRLGMRGTVVGCFDSEYCAARNYKTASFDLFRDRLLLDTATGSDECLGDGTGNGFRCTVNLGPVTEQCTFNRAAPAVAEPVYYSRAYWLTPTPAQMAALPDPNPPANTDLIAALRGNYTGYLHNETKNLYQVLSLSVMAASSTNNPHNQNQVYVTTNAVLHFGRSLSSDFFVQQFDPESFYLTQGFTLASTNSDAFLQITDWRQGYLRGIWYSREFGRVGTVELLKGDALPALASAAEFVPALSGVYVGPRGMGGDLEDLWSFGIVVPVQTPHAGVETQAFAGNIGVIDGSMPRRAIDRGAYDFYAGTLAWVSDDERFISGKVTGGTSLALFWPGIPDFGILLPVDHEQYPYLRRP